MTLVTGWQNFWKWYSMHGLAVIAAASVAWTQLTPEFQTQILTSLPHNAVAYGALALALLTAIGRVVCQTPETK